MKGDVTYIDNLSTGLDSLAQAEEDNEPGQRQGQGEVILEPVQVAEVGKSRSDIKDIFLPELLRAGLQSGAVLGYSGRTPGGGGRVNSANQSGGNIYILACFCCGK